MNTLPHSRLVQLTGIKKSREENHLSWNLITNNFFTKKLLSQQLPALFPDKLCCDPSAFGPREGVPHSPPLGVHRGAVAAQGKGLQKGGVMIL